MTRTPEYGDVPGEIIEELRSMCLALPEVDEAQAWTGARWTVRKRTVAHVLAVDGPDGSVTLLMFRSAPPELEVLHGAGHPFFKPGWGSNVVGMVLDGATDWAEVSELLTESYCVQAPKKLVALVERPDP